MRPSRLVAVAIMSLICARASHAEIEAGAVIVVGKGPARDRATVASAVRSAARSGGWELVETPLADPEIAAIVACLEAPQAWSCVAPVIATKKIQRVVIVRVETDGKAALVLTEQILLPGSNVTTSDQRVCTACVDETLTRVSFDMTKYLLEEAAAGTARTRINIRSSPPGAWITLDGTNVGLTDRTYATFPGPHLVVVQREGYEPETRKVDVSENRETIVAIALRAKIVTPPVTAEPSHLLPGIVTGAGVVALGAGIVVQVAKDPPGSGTQPAHLISTPGVALIAGGGVAIGVGVYLWMRTTRAAKATGADPRSAPTASIVTGGGIVGWTGRF
jgi:hypothetical protein